MRFYSTNQKSPEVGIKEAVLRGLAPDGGLYMPGKIPVLPSDFFTHIRSLSFQDISFEIARRLFGEDIPSKILKTIVYEALTFDAPLVRLDQKLYVLELFHGPTLAFKDFAARFMARLMGYFVQGSKKELTVLVATSGDTGSAVANGFLNIPGIRVVILYPSKKVSDIQEKQLTTMGGNITALEIQGSFDDCQNLVKESFLDKELNGSLWLTSANSINIARLLPQSFYYFYAYAQLEQAARQVVFSVPSGNFGNLTAGLVAKRMGLPVKKFIAATNANNVVPQYLDTGKFTPRTSQSTISNAMDVGNPSNFARMLDLCDNDVEKMRGDIFGASFSDEQTKEAIRDVYDRYNYILDPHGAVGYLGLKEYRSNNQAMDTHDVFLETAHPAKFKDIVEHTLAGPVDIPDRLQACLTKPKKSVLLSNKFGDVKNFLLCSPA